ncbi:DUF4387 domain-containing protein [Symbiobacterium thermophilum]|uniref:DUF4387 domain-containing protein n=2 Tax=Symbiobacterium thermophilum TaxID=2734 RepID=Q67LW4_SYMTH|nr:DUF4387 domain-containing protein [Symbiobacterium thermophilum]MBY6275258.1 DUF4387 domain-containing protein [Symbiobacterium thermophilum]OTA40850.1 MAG: acyl-CoA synthetase [Symbiobacterium thermophilum]BAD41332.1 conserved hypothetical protein [Symbiobacterium thermophilum IAM 14863]
MRLRDLASTIRSKNAGVDLITFDILFKTREAYERAKACPALSREGIARLFRIPGDRIYSYVTFDPALAIKFTLRRQRPSGSAGEHDLFGAQQYAPLLDVEVS